MVFPSTLRFVLLFGLLIGLVPRSLSADETEDSVKAAEAALDALRSTLVPRVVPEAAVGSLDVAAAMLEALVPPPKPGLFPPDPGADEAALKEAAEENKRRLRAWTVANRRFSQQRESLHTRWVKLLGTALRVERSSLQEIMHPNGEPGLRRRALALLVATGRPDAADEITKATHNWLDRERLYVAPHPLVGAFEALPRFGSPDVLRWLRTKFVGKERDYPLFSVMTRRGADLVETRDCDVPLMALQAIALHTGVPGLHRLHTVRDLVAAYRPLEARAERDDDAAALWGRVGQAAIHATSNLARKPAGESGVPLSSMARLARWLRSHNAAGDAAWKD